MTRWSRRGAWILVLALCLTTLASCGETGRSPERDPADRPVEAPSENGSQENEGGKDPTPDRAPEEETPPTETPADAVLLSEGTNSEYAIVYDAAASDGSLSLIRRFRTRFWQKTGAELKLIPDTEAYGEKAILIYDTAESAQVREQLDSLEVPGKNGYRIGFCGDDLVVACSRAEYLTSALDLLLSAIRETGENGYGLAADYVGKLDIPTPISSWQSRVQWFDTGSEQYTVRVDQVTAKQYGNYCAALEKEFLRYSSRRIGDHLFSTFVRDDEEGRMVAYTMYDPLDSCYKITYGVLGYLPDMETRESDVVTPSLTQRSCPGGGMNAIVQLSDGRFLLFDGGSYSPSGKPNDLDQLYGLLCEMTPDGGTPVIAGWFFTHAHIDHMKLAVSFLQKYYAQIELQLVGHNFPDFDRITIVNEDSDDMKVWADGLRDVLATRYPDTETWVVQTGEVIRFPNCEMEILYTQADYAINPSLGALDNDKTSFPWGNHIVTTYRLTVNDTTFLILGDSEKTLCKWMADHYTTYMKSDVLSLSHHGLNGGELSLYQYIDPDICFWPTTRETMESDRCQKWDYNKYLLNIEGYGTRDREHYCMNETTTVLCEPKFQ